MEPPAFRPLHHQRDRVTQRSQSSIVKPSIPNSILNGAIARSSIQDTPPSRPWLGVGAALILAVGVPSSAHMPQQAPVFRAEANLVEVIVRVTDEKGQFVPDLTIKNVELREEGRPETIVAFGASRSAWPVGPGSASRPGPATSSRAPVQPWIDHPTSCPSWPTPS